MLDNDDKFPKNIYAATSVDLSKSPEVDEKLKISQIIDWRSKKLKIFKNNFLTFNSLKLSILDFSTAIIKFSAATVSCVRTLDGARRKIETRRSRWTIFVNKIT